MFAVLLAAVLLISCETKSTDELEIRISPSRATIRQGETIELVASGWGGYRWSIASPLLGSLTPTTGETVYYYATAETNAVQVVTVVGTGTSSVNTTTNTSTRAVNLTGEAYITHVAPEPPPDEPAATATTNTTTTTTTSTTTTAALPPSPPLDGADA